MSRQYIVTPKFPSYGGPRSFIDKLNKELIQDYDIEITDLEQDNTRLVIIVGGTRRIFWLLHQKLKGRKIIQRLNGVNNYKLGRASMRDYILGKVGNFLIFYVRNFFADFIIYQSKFSMRSNNKAFGKISTPFNIIYNGTGDNPAASNRTSNEKINIFCCEGTIECDAYDRGLIEVIAEYAEKNEKIEYLHIFGVCKDENALKESTKNYLKTSIHGKVPFPKIQEYYQKGGIFFSLEVDGACPNSVIEAMSFGMPIVGFNTGSISELIKDQREGVIGSEITKDTKGYHTNKKNKTSLEVSSLMDITVSQFDLFAENSLQNFQTHFHIKKVAQKYAETFKGFL